MKEHVYFKTHRRSLWRNDKQQESKRDKKLIEEISQSTIKRIINGRKENTRRTTINVKVTDDSLGH